MENKKKAPGRFRRELPLVLMLLPAVILVAVYSYGSMVGTVIAFQKFNPTKGFFGSPWVGFDNFRNLFTMPTIGQVIYNTIFISLFHILKSEGNLTMSGRFCERPAGYATQMQRNTGTSLDMRARRGCERNGKKRREKKRAASGSITSPGRRPSCFLMSGCQTSLPVQK